jgi:hypothetical protein
MARSELSRSYEYRVIEGWVALPEEPTEDAPRLTPGEAPMWTPEWYKALGYEPSAHVFGKRLGGAYVEVYTQTADSDDAPYTFLCRVGLAGTLQNVYVENLPSLVSLLEELGPAMQTYQTSDPKDT